MTDPTCSSIDIRGLRKAFGPIVAVDGISFAVAPGDVVGLLGPNGAGKSTAMKILTCFMKPDDGTAVVAGHDILKEPVAVRRAVGYVAENAPAYDEMSVLGFLAFVCDARGVSGAAQRDAIARVTDSCKLGGVMHQPVGTLSKGYRRRVGLAQALVHDPQVLILDEPTDGLDPNQKHDVRNLIKTMAATKSIVISTHILEEVEAVCSRAVIMHRGQILADSTPRELCAKHGGTLEEVFRTLTYPNRAAGAATTAGGVA